MKLSNDTLAVLKNFSAINQNLMVKSGDTIATMSSMKNIISKATLGDTFENEFAIYDLNEFLSALSLFKSPNLTFSDMSVKLEEEGGGASLKYFFSDPSIVTAPKTEISMPDSDVEFTFTQDAFNQIVKASAVLGVPDLVLKTSASGDVDLLVTDRKNDTSNDFSIKVGEGASKDATYYFKVENLKMMPGDYRVQVSSKGISHFQNLNKSIEYFIALEAS
jgi:hypothetical protein